MSRMVTRNRPAQRLGAAFVLPLIAVVWASRIGDGREVDGASLFAVAAVCGAAGVAWQLLHRRDLVDRLTYAAAVVAVMAVIFFPVAWDSPVGADTGPGLGVGLAAVLTGLVYAEQWQRGRDERQGLRLREGRPDRKQSSPSV